MPFVRALRVRMSEPSFISILGGLNFLFLAVGLAVVAHAVNTRAEEIREATGIAFWPKDPDDRFKWNYLYGRPWGALVTGALVGTFFGLWSRIRTHRVEIEWIQGAVLVAKGGKHKTTKADRIWIAILLTTAAAPAFVLSIFFRFSGMIYLNALVAVAWFVPYTQLRTLRLRVNEIAVSTAKDEEERRHVAQWQFNERRSLKKMYIWTIAFGLLTLVGTIFYVPHVNCVMNDVKQTMLDRNREQ